MKIYLRARFIIVIFYVMLTSFAYSQCSQSINLQHQVDIPVQFPLLQHNMTAKRDTMASKPYLYVAGKERGLVIYNISNLTSPILTASILPSAMQNLDVMSLTQAGNYLYLALGDFFNSGSENSGMAIVDISLPAAPILMSVYSYSLSSGSGHVAVDGNYAYLSAMQNGIIVFDVTNKSNIQLVSVFKPSIHFPKVNPNTSEQQKINVRQITVKNNVLYVCDDAGGIRVVNATNKNNLLETGQYSNSLLSSRPRAYNNLILNDTLAYVAADYCGVEILNIKDTSNITQVGWWNPYNCESVATNWFTSPGYANELDYDENCKLLFVSTGRNDMRVINVANPSAPDSCTSYGNSTDSLGTWGISRYQNQLFLTYISTWPLFTPFPSKWSGVKILTYNNSCLSTGFKNNIKESGVLFFPNPVSNVLNLKVNNDRFLNKKISLLDNTGKLMYSGVISEPNFSIDVSSYSIGLYLISVKLDDEVFVRKIAVE